MPHAVSWLRCRLVKGWNRESGDGVRGTRVWQVMIGVPSTVVEPSLPGLRETTSIEKVCIPREGEEREDV